MDPKINCYNLTVLSKMLYPRISKQINKNWHISSEKCNTMSEIVKFFCSVRTVSVKLYKFESSFSERVCDVPIF